MKTCNKCGETKDFTAFYADKRYVGGYRHQCKDCTKQFPSQVSSAAVARATKWAKEHPEKRRAIKRRYWNKRLYGLTPDEFDGMVARQQGLCAICLKPPGKQGLCIDHDHTTRKVRGLLCTRCNTALGSFGDDRAVLNRAQVYLS